MDNHQSARPDCRVLAVDDNIMTLNLVMTMLKKSGIAQIETASNGEDAWEKLCTAKEQGRLYDILIIDWNMPVMNGYDVLRRCREDSGMERMAIVMLSAENQKRNILEAMKAGATSYIVKPVDADVFNEKLKQVFLWMDKSRKAS